ncbi:hypothetical protein JV46_26790 [Solemya velum gill symbiont]|uniref:Uncharacterized protein n=1 Tax=Solemya velum gill symbiont TaxID=2340 RepID=A0A0B0H9B7_SOVGS|nr:hypothetical protein JV46_26790 [Solemya velum gill symbiont]
MHRLTTLITGAFNALYFLIATVAEPGHCFWGFATHKAAPLEAQELSKILHLLTIQAPFG